ncbi:hypothetical protein FHETE_1327 [Fusarium heterosporum]|uniref:Uncharacterized protein n=1 Tax=Fusarium heterosporum TaxID=42747 RepID=A0A8H5TX73_FUSHE|nr:hypothetical protein FHETE_1327 [Fusarium heterosporum]
MHFTSILLPGLFAIVRAADDGIQLTYATATITQCFTRGGLAAPTIVVTDATYVVNKPAVTGGPIVVEVQAPDCDCGCPTCVHTLVYSTKYQAFCSTGLYEQDYVITETYKGMEAKPTLDHSIPLGFTCDVQTCTTCGPEPVTATITYPVPDHPYVNHGTYPTGAPVAVKPTGGNKGYEAEGDSKSEDEPYYPAPQSGSKSEDEPYHPEAQGASKSEDNPYHPEAPIPAKGADNEPEEGANAAPKAPVGDNQGFQSSVRPSSVAGSPESAYPGFPTEHPVVVSGAAGRDLGLAGLAITVAVFLESVLSL